MRPQIDSYQLMWLAKTLFWLFPKLVSGYQTPSHLKYIASRVQWHLENPHPNRKKKLLLIDGPPRHGKSELIPVHLPPWVLGHYPEKDIIIGSYSGELSERHSAAARDIFTAWGDTLWGVKPHPTMYNRSYWLTENRGSVRAVGFRGSTTGFGADIFLVDDYHKDEKEAESQLERDRNWSFWRSAAVPRLHPGALVIIFATRWHDDDLVGRLERQMKEQGEDFAFDVEYINLPALAEADDVLGREPGDALWPWWVTKGELEGIRDLVGPYLWSALFQGRPTPRGGKLFKYSFLRYYDIESPTGHFLCYRDGVSEPLRVNKKGITRETFVDPALEIKKTNDPTGMHAWGYDRINKVWLLLDRIVDKIEFTKIFETVASFAAKNGCLRIGAENEKLGKVLVKQSAGNDQLKGARIPWREVPIGGLDKFARATGMATYMENERVFLPRNAPWLDEFISNLVKFPNAQTDEDVDCLSMAEHLEDKSSMLEALERLRRGQS